MKSTSVISKSLFICWRDFFYVNWENEFFGLKISSLLAVSGDITMRKYRRHKLSMPYMHLQYFLLTHIRTLHAMGDPA